MADDGILGMLADPAAAKAQSVAEAREIAQIGGNLPPSLQIMLDDRLYTRVKNLANLMAQDTAFTPKHLRGKPAACFTVLNQALDWKLAPQFVARNTYETPGGAIGFMGVLVQAVLEQSGRFIGAPQFEHTGDWSKVVGKFEIGKSQKGNDFVKRTWTQKDAESLGVRVRWRLRNEQEPRCWPSENNPPFMLTQCFPLNSPLWATDPITQISYLAIRRFANQAAPGLLGGMPFDHEEFLDASETAKDVTPPPRPKREDFVDAQVEPEPEAEATFAVIDLDGVEYEHPAGGAIAALAEIFDEAARRGMPTLTGAAESNRGTLDALNEVDPQAVSELRDLYVAHLNSLKIPERATAVDPEPKPPEAADGEDAEDGAGSSSEAAPAERGGGPATNRSRMPGDTGTPGRAGDAGGNPAAAAPATQPAQGSDLFPASAPETASPAPAAPQRPARAKWYDQESLRLEPTRNGNRTNWSGWYSAMFLPRLKGAQNTPDLGHLLGDNADLIEEFEGAVKPEEARLMRQAIDQQWAKITAWESTQ